jgi:hypothetical protein
MTCAFVSLMIEAVRVTAEAASCKEYKTEQRKNPNHFTENKCFSTEALLICAI